MFITASQALDMLQAHAPRAWAKRLLMWQVFYSDTKLYFRSGVRCEFVRGHTLLVESADADGVESIENVRAKFGDDIAERVKTVGRFGEPIEYSREEWTDEPRDLPVAALIYAEYLDWESGYVKLDMDPSFIGAAFIDENEDFQGEFEHSDLRFELRGMSFELEAIEMLAPGGQPPSPTLPGLQPDLPRKQRVARGRTAKWDWEGAIAHIAGIANKPDGIPTGHGAQAHIARLLGTWFAEREGDSPADSELRLRAANILGALETAGK